MAINFQFEGGRKLTREVTAARLNQILEEIRRAKPLPGVGITTRQEVGGVRIDNLGGGGGSGAAAAVRRQPWDIYVSKKEEDGSFKLRVQPGTVSQLLPTNWQDEFQASSETLYYGIASVATDGRFVTAVTIDITLGAPTNQEAQKYGVDDPVEILFGLFKDGKSYNVAGGRNIPLIAEAVLATSADPPASVGQSPYDIWFRLQ
jgi:hypothetical protein